MIRLFRLFQNPFTHRQISFDELVACATDTLQRLIANNPGALYNSLITALTTTLSQLGTCQSDDILKLGLRMSAKQAKGIFRKHLPEQLGKIHSKVAGHYGPKAPELNTVFPGGRDIVSNALDDDLDDRLTAVISGLAVVAGPMGAVGTAAQGDAGGLLSTWLALYAASESTSGGKTFTEAEKRKIRDKLAAQLHVVLKTISLNIATAALAANRSVTDEEAKAAAALYFRQDLLEDPGSPEEEEEGGEEGGEEPAPPVP